MKENCKNNLDELIHLLSQMTDSEYSKPCRSIFGATIGQHTRHIIELYLEFIQGAKVNEVCYDNRKRNVLLETNVTAAIEMIEMIKAGIKTMKDAPVKLKANFTENETSTMINTSVFRELAYNLEHSIHHQALIKVGLNELGRLNLIDKNFGLAPATIRFKKEVINHSIK